MRLLAGILVLESLAAGEETIDRIKVNKVLSAEIGNGYSWYSAVKFLTGKRAREIFTSRIDLIREIGGSKLVHLFNVVLPTIGDVMELVERKTRTAQSHA